MKKIFLIGAMAFFGVMNAQSGNFKVGAHVGYPGLPFGLGTNFNAGVDVAYMYPVTDKLKLGITTGYSHYFAGKGSLLRELADSSGLGIIPAAASIDYNVTPKFYLGADVGYAFAVGNKDLSGTGGFYAQPKIGYNITPNHNLYISYKTMASIGGKDGSSFVGSINLGYAYTFGK